MLIDVDTCHCSLHLARSPGTIEFEADVGKGSGWSFHGEAFHSRASAKGTFSEFTVVFKELDDCSHTHWTSITFPTAIPRASVP